MNPQADDRPDRHLQAALRHAPDHDLAAPDAVSARILAQARAAVPAQAAAAQPGWLERWFGWMSQPVAAGAFGTLLIAGFVGLMWRGGPPPEAMPGAEREVPAVATAPVPAVAPAATPPAPPPVATQAPAPAPVPTPAPPAAQPSAERARMPATPPPERRAATSVARPAPAPATTGGTLEAPVGTAAADAAANKVAAPQASPPPASPPPAPAAAAAPAPFPAAAPAPAPATPRAALRQRSDAAAFDPLVPALAALLQSPGHAWQARLQRLQQRLATPWVPGGTPPADGGDTVTDNQGQRLGRLWLQGPVILWQDPDGNLWRATLRDE